MKLSKVLNSFKINNENKIKVIGLLTILIAFWLVFYFIPEIFVSLFHTFLGNLILIVSVLLIYMNNRLYGLMIGLVLLVLFRFSQLSNQKQREQFSLNINGTFEIDDETLQNGAGLTEDSKLNFLRIQDTINKQKVFDMNVLETQATQEELDYFNKHGKWPWSRRVINLYKESVRNNPFIRTVPEQAANYARTIYNQSAILRLLSYQTKEGDFLLNGVLVKDPSGNSAEDLPSGFGEFGYSSGLLGNRSYDVIKCNLKDDYIWYLDCLCNSLCNSLNNGNSFGFTVSVIKDGCDSSGLSFNPHRYCHTLLINGDLFFTFKRKGHE